MARWVAWMIAVATSACAAHAHQGPGTGGGTGTGSAGGAGGGGDTTGSASILQLGLGGAATSACPVADPQADMDGDGWTPAQGDCNDCDPEVNPGAVDTVSVIGGATVLGDEDCDGKPGEVPGPCDEGLAIDDPDPAHAAAAMEICTTLTDPRRWGMVGARWALPDGAPPSAMVPTGFGSAGSTPKSAYELGHGILPAFGPGVGVIAGSRLLALSSGTARRPGDPGYRDPSGFDKGYTSGAPPGFPKAAPACPGIVTGQPHDGIALEVDLVAPTNAHGLAFGFAFFTYEWPTWVCSTFNDLFVAWLLPFPAGQQDGNVSFDGMGNPVSVNNAFVDACGCAGGPPCTAGIGATQRVFPCSLGDAGLIGTGFGADTAGVDHASTGWLTTEAPVSPHEAITLRFSVHDSGDGLLDTTTLVDGFRWIAAPGVAVDTSPADPPK